jgi:hypothetical protein
MKRKPITLATKVAVLLLQARCAKCGGILGADVEWNHIMPHALGGGDGPDNIEAVHEACHAEITNGTKATTAGSTKHVVAKAKRLRKTYGLAVDMNLKEDRAPTGPVKIDKRFSRKLASRSFPKPPPGHQHFPKGRKVQP